jgi:hypothetical protein
MSSQSLCLFCEDQKKSNLLAQRRLMAPASIWPPENKHLTQKYTFGVHAGGIAFTGPFGRQRDTIFGLVLLIFP